MYRQVSKLGPVGGAASGAVARGFRLSAIRTYADSPYVTSSPSRLGPNPPGIPPTPPSSINSKAVPSVTIPSSVNKSDVFVPAAANLRDPSKVSGTVIPPDNVNSSSEIPPPPPPPPSGKKGGLGRRLVFWLTLTTLIFYPTSALISEHSDAYRDFFTSTFPLAEAIVDFADDNDWESFGPSTIVATIKRLTGSAEEGSVAGFGSEKGPKGSVTTPARRVDFPPQPATTATGASETKSSFGEALKKELEAAKDKVEKGVDQAKSKVDELSARAKDTAKDIQKEASKAGDRLEKNLQQGKEKVKSAAEDAKSAALDVKEKEKSAAANAKDKADAAAADAKRQAKSLADKAKKDATDAANKAGNAASQAKNQAVAAGSALSDDVKSLVDQAESALKPGSADNVAPGAQGKLVDTQPPRKLDAEAGATPEGDLEKAGKKAWTGPLPIGFEPPPGYFVPKAVAKEVQPASPRAQDRPAPVEPPKERLPLLAPKVKEFESGEPIITQLASTIDTLASQVSTSDVTVLNQAQTDLVTLADRLKALKEHEKVQLEKSLAQKAQEFDAELRKREQEWTNKEGQLIDGWKEEREKLVDGWKKVLDRELEGQRTGIEQRLREEVIAQGIELQRRWLRSIKAQVEQERGGRLAKLDNLTTSFKQLERITIDNSNQLDANVSLHTLWSALRSVQAKADRGNVSFADDLRVLKSAAQSQIFSKDEKTRDVISAMIDSIENSGSASAGIKSFPSLASWFTTTLAPKIQSVSLVPAEHEAGLMSHIASAGLSKLLFRRKAGWVEGDDVGSIVARTEYLLAAKDLDGAARELNQLSGWASKLASDWMREARKRLEVEQALNVIATEATLSSLLLV